MRTAPRSRTMHSRCWPTRVKTCLKRKRTVITRCTALSRFHCNLFLPSLYHSADLPHNSYAFELYQNISLQNCFYQLLGPQVMPMGSARSVDRTHCFFLRFPYSWFQFHYCHKNCIGIKFLCSLHKHVFPLPVTVYIPGFKHQPEFR